MEVTSPPSETTPQHDAVIKAAKATDAKKDLTNAERADATNWFLAGSPEGPAKVHFQLNVGVDSRNPHWINWTVQAMDRDRITEIRSSASDEYDDVAKAGMVANTRIAVEATVTPNLKELRGEYADPADALTARFGFKPGLIDQIAQKVLKATGYEDSDVREVDAVKN